MFLTITENVIQIQVTEITLKRKDSTVGYIPCSRAWICPNVNWDYFWLTGTILAI